MAQQVIQACGIKGNVNALKTLYKQFSNDPNIKKNIKEDNIEEAFIHLVEAEIGMTLEDTNHFDVSKGKFRGVKNKINKISRAYRKGKLSSGIVEMLYTSSAIAGRNPEVKGMLEKFIHISHALKGRQQKHGAMYNNVLSHIRREAIHRGYETESMLGRTTQALLNKTVKAKADKLENDIMKATADYQNKKPGAENKLKQLRAEETKFYLQEEGKIFTELLHHIETSIPEMYAKLEADGVKNPKIEDYIKDFKNLDGSKISDHGMQGAVKEYLGIIDETWKVLDNGVDAFIGSITEGLKKTASGGEIKAIKESLEKRMKPHKVKGYYPHYTRDLNTGFIQGLMPHLEAVNQATGLRVSGHDKNVSNGALKDLKTYVDSVDEGYLSGHAKGRVESNEYSKNFLTVMKNYIDEVNRFNFVSHSNKAARESISTVTELWRKGGDLEGYGQSVVQYMQDLHAAQTGVRAVQNPQVDAMMRTMLGMEFVSKLGWNFRSGLRNLTQSVLNYVQFGFKANRNADEYIESLPLENVSGGVRRKWGDRISMNKDMEDAGFLFVEGAPQLEEALGIRGSMHKVLEFNENTGKLEFKPIGKVQKTAAAVSKVAGKSAFIMQKVENYNRERTYKTAFATLHKRLAENHSYKRALMDGEIVKGKKMSSDQVESYIWKKSKDYAINMVNMLHFDYADVSKSKIMRNPLGKILFQFQHYGFKFAELNANILGGAKNDMLSGSLKGDDIMKAYRMSMIYFLAPVLAAGLTGVDFSNLLEHDTKQRIVQLSTVLTGDEEAVEAATYGRGFTAMIGGPLVSDVLALGNLMGFVDLDKSELNNFLTGYQRQADLDSDEKSAEFARIFSTALSRGYNSTLPLVMSGNIGFALQLESGIMSSKESRDIREKAKKGVAAILPTDQDEIMKALSLIQESPKKGLPQIY